MRVRVEVREQAGRLGPGVLRPVTGDDVQSDPEAHLPSQALARCRGPPRASRHLVDWFSPGEVDVGVPSGHRHRRSRGPTEVDQWDRVGRRGECRTFDGQVLPLEVDLACRTTDRGRWRGTRPCGRNGRPCPRSRRSARCSARSPPVTTLTSSRPPDWRWNVAPICAARVGE